jgi:thiosulfate/3-mercaptopyruvate sulfurtransferase
MKLLLTLLLTTLTLFANNAFIKAEDLYSKLNDKNLVIIDTTNQQNYEQGHITNARRADISAFRHWVDKTYLLMNSPQEIQTAARNLGINDDSYVVLYGHNNPKELLKASYIALSLIVNGFDNVSILDGGFSEWKNRLLDKEDAISLQTPTYIKGNFTAKYNPSVLVDMQYVKEKVGKTAMIEARPKKFYNGSAQSPGVKRLGHISGAKSSFWLDKFNKDEMLQDDKKLKKIFFEENNLDTNKEVITYCTGGLEASMNWYILTQYLDFKDVKLYDASMKEWGNLQNTPMQK